MKPRTWRKMSIVAGFIAIAACVGSQGSCQTETSQTEADRVVKLLLAPPDIKTESGFTAKVLVPPGELYDPLFMFQHNGAVWLTDDGGEVDRTGSRIVSVNSRGKVSVIVPYTTTVPMISGGFAPPGFGNSPARSSCSRSQKRRLQALWSITLSSGSTRQRITLRR